ncbi:MAG TPA: PQQ-binding-like beta-propeller repeat protein [Fimbriimonadaceae bacterium]|nr:PQQ-binding-like beta-propeller repeat protein [Fimbriimonadaceae bacterium]
MLRNRAFRFGTTVTTLVALVLLSALVALSQNYPTHRGSNARTGQHDADPKTSNPGRANLRWWDPLVGIRDVIDNWEPAASWTPVADWLAPTDEGATNAIDVEGTPLLEPNYRYAFCVPSVPGDDTTPVPGFTKRTFTWTWPVFPGSPREFTLWVNIPIGPTDIDPDPNLTDLAYQQRYFVYQIDGVVNPDAPGQPVLQIVDTFAHGGGWVRLGNNGNTTDIVFTNDNSGPITVTLLNTIPRDAQGNLTDTRKGLVVYADAAMLMRGQGGLGQYIASPIVSQLKQGGAPFPWRVVTARNEAFATQNGSRILDYNLGNVNSFRHDGFFIKPSDDGTGTRNLVWSWPAKRPAEDTAAEYQRFAQEKRNFVLGLGSTAPAPSRALHNIYVDNRSVGVTWNPLLWLVNPVTPTNKGVDFLDLPITNSTASVERVVFAPNLGIPKSDPETYEIYMWLPGDASLPKELRVEIYEGGIIVPDPLAAAAGRTSIKVDQSAGTGWVRLQTTLRTAFNHRSTAPLSVAVTNFTQAPGDAGKRAYADMIRFVKKADLSFTSTPLHVRTKVRVTPGGAPVDRDVVIVAMENGRIYCVDAVGDINTGRTNVYWAYPSEMASGTDPNWTVNQDGPDGIAENPIGFDLSSALVQSIETSPGVFEDFLYVGTRNGRVYCIDVAGRGDGTATQYGTTTRRWSYPDDWPAATAVKSNLGPITGSVAFNRLAGGQQVIYVPTPQGRLFALDAVGNTANRTTTELWTFPQLVDPPIGPITMTPAVRFGRVYFGTGGGAAVGNRTFYAIDEITQTPDWTFVAPEPFNTSSPAVIPAGDINYTASPGGPRNGMPNTVFVASVDSVVRAINAENGALIWQTSELNSTAVASLTFTYLRVFNQGGLTLNPPGAPVIMVPTIDGNFNALFAHFVDQNSSGGRFCWGYTTEGDSVIGSMAVGGQYPADNYCWLYGVDSLGYIYAFEDDPGIITPGTPPGDRRTTPDDQESIAPYASQARVAWLVPNDYETLRKRLSLGTLTYNNIIQAIAARPVTRLNFDYGESLYLVVYNVPDPASLTGNLANYVSEVQLNTPGAASQRRQISIQKIPSVQAGQLDGVAFTQLSLLGTGGNALAPGRGSITVRLTVPSGRTQTASVPPANFNPSNSFSLANPLGVWVKPNPATNQTIGTTTDAASQEVLNNGNLVGAVNPVDRVLTAGLGPDPSQPGDKISHGQSAVNIMNIYDRSCMVLLLGPERGLQNVRLQVNDLGWVPTNLLDNYGVIKPLQPASAWPGLYPNMEEFPSQQPNVSLDYPDIRREGLRFTRELFGEVANPMFAGIGLNPPKFDSAARTAYQGAGYNTQLNRTLERTEIQVDLDVMKHQPPSRAGYNGQQVVYVDANQAGRNFAGGSPTEAFRWFNLFGDVAIDERMTIGTPTVDLGSLPMGGGFLPIAPFNLISPFTPWGSTYETFFQRFSVFNEGNVNMLNVRLAKATDRLQGLGRFYNSIRLGGPGLHELAWLDAPLHLYSDLDPRFAPAAFNGRVVFQKARPGSTASRLNINPIRLPNANLGVTPTALDPLLLPGPLLPIVNFPLGDPKVGVTAPIGTPVGSYVQDMWVIEDRNDDLSVGPDPLPDLLNPARPPEPAIFEPYADPGFVLKFTVRESRLTNLPTPKTAPMVDNLGLSGNEPFLWSNAQPSGVRSGNGGLLLAFASPRVTNAGPGWNSRLKVDADNGQPEPWRIYIGSLAGSTPANYQQGVQESALRDLNQFVPFNAGPANGRWFRHEVGPYPTQPPTDLWAPMGNTTIQAGSTRYGSPVFPTNGFFNPLEPIGINGRTASPSLYMTFVGETIKRAPNGDSVPESRLFITQVGMANDGTVTIGNAVPMVFDPEVRKTRPSMVQVGPTATVFYGTNAAGLGQIAWNVYNPGNGDPNAINGWSPTRALNLGNAFESVGTPSVNLRRYRQGSQFQRIDMVFTAKLRGRSQAEAWLARLVADDQGRPTNTPIISFGTAASPRVDPITIDPATGSYWAPGIQWRIDGNFGTAIDLRQYTSAGLTSIVNQGSRKTDASGNVISFDTTYGGKVYLDAGNGSIRFTGAMLPRNIQLAIRYVPTFLRVSAGQGANYRGAGILFDERFIGEFGYWLTPGPNANLDNAVAASDLARSDRFLVSYARTSADGSSVARPFLRTLRFGVQLPAGIRTDNNGNLLRMKVTAAVPQPGDPQIFYQVSPATGRVYFNSEFEDRDVRISFEAVNEAGQPIGVLTDVYRVDILGELAETAIPIEQTANESAVSMALDPLNSAFNDRNFRRPGLIWLFWTSTRAGGPDLYFETLAPRFTPLPPNRP